MLEKTQRRRLRRSLLGWCLRGECLRADVASHSQVLVVVSPASSAETDLQVTYIRAWRRGLSEAHSVDTFFSREFQHCGDEEAERASSWWQARPCCIMRRSVPAAIELRRRQPQRNYFDGIARGRHCSLHAVVPISSNRRPVLTP